MCRKFSFSLLRSIANNEIRLKACKISCSLKRSNYRSQNLPFNLNSRPVPLPLLHCLAPSSHQFDYPLPASQIPGPSLSSSYFQPVTYEFIFPRQMKNSEEYSWFMGNPRNRIEKILLHLVESQSSSKMFRVFKTVLYSYRIYLNIQSKSNLLQGSW